MLRKGKNGLEEIYVVGCGPSLKNFNWSWLSDKTTIVANGSVRDVPEPDFFITGDSAYAITHAKSEFWNLPSCNVLIMKSDHKYYKRVEPYVPLYDWVIPPKFDDGFIGFTEDNFHTGQNSGFCGMQLAVILGAKKIHLLGMDFNVDGGLHYHKYYSNLFCSKLREYLRHFVMAIQVLSVSNIEVINHSVTSSLCSYIGYEELR